MESDLNSRDNNPLFFPQTAEEQYEVAATDWDFGYPHPD
jgi:hypothetical protein